MKEEHLIPRRLFTIIFGHISFYAFCKITGMTPNKYRSEHTIQEESHENTYL